MIDLLSIHPTGFFDILCYRRTHAGVINHVVNGVGAAADMTKVGAPVYVTDYPAAP